MYLTVNGEERSLDDGTTVSALVLQLTTSDRGVAVARNGEVVPKSIWATVALEGGDFVEVLEATRGG